VTGATADTLSPVFRFSSRQCVVTGLLKGEDPIALTEPGTEGFLTPAVVHYGLAPAVRAHRQDVLTAAYAVHPERFVNGMPQPAELPQAVWINPPTKKRPLRMPYERRSEP
jgi:hypothetical protein